ncbi:SDR family NAD(P)-dependent oxidoreductase [Cupriavidus pauculus]|uniref:SDR family NAD(P)-dependent oxidoreductase n=1 Tax=Cupriavidus pauculus TaxID=82633 RepID=UPI001478D400|nr:SDR family NAD(P)-dependent oxidoreductase [Cupriavidus pauculus]
MDGSRSYSRFAFYGQSKLATALFAKELSRRLAGAKISVNSIHPGATRGTNLNANVRFPLNVVLSVAQLFIKSISQGAAPQVLLAAHPLAEGMTGDYWADCQPAKGSPLLENSEISRKLWDFSENFFWSLRASCS